MSKKNGTKKEFLPFYLTDLDAVARHFEEKAAEGWMLKSFLNTCEYEPCEPKHVRFNVVQCPVKGSDNAKISEASREFIDLCEESGWRFIDHRGAVYAFCCENDDVPDIITDELQRVEAVEKAGRNNTLFTFLIGFLIGAQIYSYIRRAVDPGDDRMMSIGIALFFALMLILLFCGMYINRINERKWREKAIDAIEAGEPIPPSEGNVLKKRRITAVIFIVILIAAALGLLANALIFSNPAARCYLLSALAAAVPFALIFNKLIKRKKAGKRITIAFIGAIIGWIVLQLILFAILGSVFHAFDELEETAALLGHVSSYISNAFPF